MPRRGWKLRIKDILNAINAVLTYTEGMKYETFVSDRKTVDAVMRNLIIIGEPASNVADDFLAEHPNLPWRDMRDMRNFVVHEYFGVSDKIIWDTVQNDLPPLIPQLRQLLESRQSDQSQ